MLTLGSRFPHPLSTTLLHLVIALTALTTASTASKAILRAQSSSSQHAQASAPATYTTRCLEVLAETMPSSPRSFWLACTSRRAFYCAVAACFAALCEIKASRVVETPCWTVGRLAPLAILATGSCLSTPGTESAQSQARQRGTLGLLVWAILMAGPATVGALEITSGHGMALTAAYAVAIVAWVRSASSSAAHDTSDEPATS